MTDSTMIVEKKIPAGWEKIIYTELVAGDIFRLAKPEGGFLSDGAGISAWKVTKAPYVNEENKWVIYCEPIELEKETSKK